MEQKKQLSPWMEAQIRLLAGSFPGVALHLSVNRAVALLSIKVPFGCRSRAIRSIPPLVVRCCETRPRFNNFFVFVRAAWNLKIICPSILELLL